MAENVEYILSLKDLFLSKIKEADSAAKGLEGTIDGIKTGIAAAFSGYALGGFINSVVTAGAKVEDARTGLTTLLRDSNEAQRVISNTMSDATKMPFGFEPLLMANKALISAGENADAARETVINLGNAIAATGGGDVELQGMVVNMQQIRNTGVATAQDIKQFAFAGINIYKILADATGKNIDQIKDTAVSYDMLVGALKKAHDIGGAYANGLENMAGNTSVQISNMGDAIFQLKVKMFDDLKPAISIVIEKMSGFIDSMRDAWDWSVKNKEAIQALGITIGITAISIGLYNSYLKFTTIYTAAAATVTELYGWYTLATAEGMGVLTAAQFALNAVMSANPIGIVVVALAALAGGIYYAWQKSEQFRGGVMGVWEVMKGFGNFIVTYFKSVGEILAGVFTLDADRIVAGTKGAIKAYYDLGMNVGANFQKGYSKGVNDLKKDELDAPLSKKGPATAKSKFGMSPAGPAAKGTKTPSAANVTGQKVYTINISIDSLVKDFKVQTTNMTEGAGKVKDLVTQALLSAVNDSQIIAER